MSWSEVWDLIVGRPLTIFLLVVLGLVARWLLHRLVDRLIARAETAVLPERVSALTATDDTRRVQRARTLGGLLKSIVNGVVIAVVGTMILSEFVDVGPIIASAGIVGIALGFGAQTLVKDFISGVFMIFEDQYGVGDAVDLGEASGTVEAVGLRVTRLRDVNGTVWYVRNGEIIRVGNQSQNWARTVLDVVVAYQSDLHQVERVLQEVARSVWEDEEYSGVIIEEPEVWGVESITPDGVTVRVTLKTAPLEQWRVAREMRARVKDRFQAEGIEVPQRMPWTIHPDTPR